VLGVYEGTALRDHWRLGTDRERSADEYGVVIRALLGDTRTAIDGIAVACVAARSGEGPRLAMPKFGWWILKRRLRWRPTQLFKLHAKPQYR
jgi:pantothenate kinase type III